LIFGLNEKQVGPSSLLLAVLFVFAAAALVAEPPAMAAALKAEDVQPGYRQVARWRLSGVSSCE
jgi:hypothetical protein